jgi:NADH:ubiquinone oxidoreductase subunit 6 (subunit J)
MMNADFPIWGIIGVVFMLIVFALAVLIFVFWVLMLVNCIKRKFKSENDKLIWALVIIFLGVLGSVIYYFIVKKGK